MKVPHGAVTIHAPSEGAFFTSGDGTTVRRRNVGALQDAASSGDKRKMLEAMRDKLVATIDGTDSGRDVSSLMRRLLEVVNELDTMPEPEDDSPLSRAING